MTAETEDESVRVLDEDDGVELLEPNASARLRPLLRDVRQGCSETAVQAGDPAGYVERLDALCRTVAEYLVRSLGLDRSP
jgi:hypothetical protein